MFKFLSDIIEAIKEHHATDDPISQDNEFRISKSLQIFMILVTILLIVFGLTVCGGSNVSWS